MSRPTYVEIACKSALNRVRGMPFDWSLNPYSGCSHACTYCYARAFYAKADHGDGGRDFETRIYVKTNVVPVLRRELARPSWKGDAIAIGSSTDAYQPAEGRYRLTRGIVEALLDRGNPASLVTKSPLIVRDADLWAELSRRAKVRVCFTVTTLDHDLWRLVEPGTPPPIQRLRALRRLVDLGVPAGVLLAPILPGLTDSAASIEAVARAARDHGAAFFGATALRLAPVVKQNYLEFVDQSFPALSPRYRRAYPRTNAPEDYQAKLNERVDAIRARHGFGDGSMRQRYSGFAPAGPAIPGGSRQLPLALQAGPDSPDSLSR